MANLADVEARLRAAIEKVRADGWTITAGYYGNTESRCCCALGAYVVSNDPWLLRHYGSISDWLEGALDIDGDQRSSIAAGFDGRRGPVFEGTAAYALGARLRAEYLPPVTP